MTYATTMLSQIRGLLVILLLGVPAQLLAQDRAPARKAGLPAMAELAPGWTTLRPGGETTCAHGTDFEFYARPAASDSLLVYFHGGGACWDAEGCQEGSPLYVQKIEPWHHPEQNSGILDTGHPENPFAGYSMVVVPVCTGDTYLGDRYAVYRLETDDGRLRDFTVRHRGQANVRAVLQWIYANVEAPREIFVAGSSAGGVAVPFYANLIAQHYPEAGVTGLGDDAGSYNTASNAGADLNRWGIPEVLRRYPGWEEVLGRIGTNSLFIMASRNRPNLRLAQIDHAYDRVQTRYLELMGTEDPDIQTLLHTNRQRIRDAAPAFRGFTVGGVEHQVLNTPFFYRYLPVEGYRVRDWVAALAAGEAVPDVACDDCTRSRYAYDADDLRILDRTLELLSGPGAWDPSDEGPCAEEAGPYSLRCALVKATVDVYGRFLQAPAGWDLVYAAAEHLSEQPFEQTMQRYNDAEGRTVAEVVALVEEVRSRIQTNLAANR